MSCSSKRNIEVGSCISTLVSRTNRRRMARPAPAVPVTEAPGASGGCCSERLRRFKYFLHVSVYLHLAPFAPQYTRRVDEERAALDSHVLAPVHGLFLDHIKQPADLLVGIGQQRIGQL